jgi:hypothetical protein
VRPLIKGDTSAAYLQGLCPFAGAGEQLNFAS